MVMKVSCASSAFKEDHPNVKFPITASVPLHTSDADQLHVPHQVEARQKLHVVCTEPSLLVQMAQKGQKVQRHPQKNNTEVDCNNSSRSKLLVRAKKIVSSAISKVSPKFSKTSRIFNLGDVNGNFSVEHLSFEGLEGNQSSNKDSRQFITDSEPSLRLKRGHSSKPDILPSSACYDDANLSLWQSELPSPVHSDRQSRSRSDASCYSDKSSISDVFFNSEHQGVTGDYFFSERDSSIADSSYTSTQVGAPIRVIRQSRSRSNARCYSDNSSISNQSLESEHRALSDACFYSERDSLIEGSSIADSSYTSTQVGAPIRVIRQSRSRSNARCYSDNSSTSNQSLESEHRALSDACFYSERESFIEGVFNTSTTKVGAPIS